MRMIASSRRALSYALRLSLGAFTSMFQLSLSSAMGINSCGVLCRGASMGIHPGGCGFWRVRIACRVILDSSDRSTWPKKRSRRTLRVATKSQLGQRYSERVEFPVMNDNRLAAQDLSIFTLESFRCHASKPCVAIEQTPDSKSCSFVRKSNDLDLQMLCN